MLLLVSLNKLVSIETGLDQNVADAKKLLNAIEQKDLDDQNIYNRLKSIAKTLSGNEKAGDYEALITVATVSYTHLTLPTIYSV